MSPEESKWHQWPARIPRPTAEEFAKAEARYKAEQPNGNGLGYEMATVHRLCWWAYFFPEQRAKCAQEFRRLLSDISDNSR